MAQLQGGQLDFGAVKHFLLEQALRDRVQAVVLAYEARLVTPSS